MLLQWRSEVLYFIIDLSLDVYKKVLFQRLYKSLPKNHPTCVEFTLDIHGDLKINGQKVIINKGLVNS